MKTVRFVICFFLFPAFVMLINGLPAYGESLNKFYRMSGEEILEYSEQTDGRKAFFIYASWCGVCQQKLPSMVDIAKAKPGSIIPVSVDQDPKATARLLKQYEDNLPFYMIMYDTKRGQSLEALLEVPESNYIPYIILVDESGSSVDSGNLSAEEVAEFVLSE